MDKTEKNTTPVTASEEPATFTKVIGKTTYKVKVHFSQTSTETMSDKIMRMIKNDILYQNEKNSL